MKFSVIHGEDIIKQYDMPIFGDDSCNEKILSTIRKMWRDICDWRDSADCVVRISIRGEIDAVGKNEVAIGLNLVGFCNVMAYYANAYLPKAEGAAALRAIFEDSCLSWESTRDYIMDHGKIKPFLPESAGVFSFHFYEPQEWAKHSMVAIAGAGDFIPYHIQDYSVICDTVNQCPAKARPMIWVNPYIVRAFIKTQDSDMVATTMQTYASSFIITAALEAHEGEVDDGMVYQLWDAMRAFAEDGDSFALKDIYNSAEQLLQARH